LVETIFIDTNIFVGYLILSGIKKTRKVDERKKLWKRYEKINPCLKFLSKVLRNKDNKNQFVTSPLVFSELPHAIHEEALCNKMWDDGVPFSSWFRVRERFIKLFEPFEIKELKRDILKLYDKGNIEILEELYDLNMIPDFILDFGLKTQDAILFSTAINRKCNFFVSRDEDFLKNELLKKNYKKIKILSPEEAIKKFFPPKEYRKV